MASTDNIKIAVRVRPFNDRETERKSKCIIEMKDNITTIIKPAIAGQPEERKSFTFDRSYWSHDGYQETHDGLLVPGKIIDGHPSYVDQNKVFADFGRTMLDNAFNGYNTSKLATHLAL